ncbi:MAG: hypothetical protein QME90_17465 [Thermodesulfobacteriota bacterium]|nr:hypothetical protein [Thermodesulfobacteriota bacterium]
MSKDPMQRYAESLEKTIQHNFNYLKEAMEDFKALCLLVTPERSTPPEIIMDIRELYKEVRDRLAEIKAIQQVLQGKYRQYYQRDSLRDKAIMEFGFLTKNLYSKFEYILLQKQAVARRKKDEEKEEDISRTEQKGFPCQWFRSKEHQVIFVRNLRILNELDYEKPHDLGIEERREVVQDRVRPLTLFCFKGEAGAIDELYPRIKLREHDLIERFAQDELHGLIAHLKEIRPVELEEFFQRIIKTEGFIKLKCLLLTIRSSKDLESDLFELMKKTLEEMEDGEVKTLRALKNNHTLS